MPNIKKIFILKDNSLLVKYKKGNLIKYPYLPALLEQARQEGIPIIKN